MNNLFDRIDNIDITSILTEDADSIQKELDIEFSGLWEDNQKPLSGNEIELNNILREISDSLAIMNEDINKLSSKEITTLIENVLDRVEPRWDNSLFESVVKSLNITHSDLIIKAKTLKEDDELNREAILMSAEVEDRIREYGCTDITELSFEEQREVINDVLTFNFGSNYDKSLAKATAIECGAASDLFEEDSVEVMDDTTAIDNNDKSIKDIQSKIASLKSGLEGLDKTDEVSDESKFEVDGKEYTKASANSEINKLEKDLEKLSKDKNNDLDNAFGENKLREDEITDSDDNSEELSYEDIQYMSDEQRHELYKNKTGKDFIDNDEFWNWAEEVYLTESIATVTTVDNIDQESKDKATIDKAIEIIGDATTIDNDQFRDLRLKLANKDYDVIDRLKDYALVRGEDVIYTWLRAEDTKDNINENVNINISDGNVNVTTDKTNINVTEPTNEPVIDLEPVDNSEEPIDDVLDAEGSEEPIEEPEKDLNLIDSENLTEDVNDIKNHILESFDDEVDVIDISTVKNNYPEDTEEDIITAAKELEAEGKVSVNDNLISKLKFEESEGLQVDNIPAKTDHKRIELAKFESDNKTTYRISYLKEDDEEIMGWDLDVDSDDEAIEVLDGVDGLLNIDFIDTGIDGITSSEYDGAELMLNKGDNESIITITQEDKDPVIVKGESLADMISQLVNWYIAR